VCGIAGSFAYAAAAENLTDEQLLRVREAMARRGPDGEGLWWNERRRIGLAHRRLAILDLDSRALQPMHLPEHGLTIVFNGEIYNFRALRDELEAAGSRFSTESDTEVLLALFAAHGPEMVHKLRGMFALAIWNEREQRLFLARDPYGIKPLYYADEGGLLQFASQVRALLSSPRVSRESDPAGIVGFHLWGSVPEPFTLYRSIRALPSGSWMWADRQGVGTPNRYASPARILAEAKRDDQTPIAEVIAKAALDSVRAHLTADVEVGTFLSSGMDSGSLVGLMRDAGQSRIKAITLAFDELKGSPQDEAPLAARVARHYGAEHHVRVVSKADFDAGVDRILSDMDQPSIDGVNTWFVSRAASEFGLKVVLSGLGGDELLGGYPSFRRIPALHRTFGAAARLPFVASMARSLLNRFAPGLVQRNPKVLGLLDHSDSWEGAYLLTRAVLLPFELDRRLDEETVREGLQRLRPLDRVAEAIEPRPRSGRATVSALESSLYMRNQLLRDSDWASMAHSLELRVPYVDWPTLGAIAPIAHRLKNGSGKQALGRAPSTPLPDDVLNRARTGFSVPVGRWIGATSDRTDRLASRHWSENVLRAFVPSSFEQAGRHA
jgi:asparagine synthase (glutamine-hydrolysing)